MSVVYVEVFVCEANAAVAASDADEGADEAAVSEGSASGDAGGKVGAASWVVDVAHVVY